MAFSPCQSTPEFVSTDGEALNFICDTLATWFSEDIIHGPYSVRFFSVSSAPDRYTIRVILEWNPVYSFIVNVFADHITIDSLTPAVSNAHISEQDPRTVVWTPAPGAIYRLTFTWEDTNFPRVTGLLNVSPSVDVAIAYSPEGEIIPILAAAPSHPCHPCDPCHPRPPHKVAIPTLRTIATFRPNTVRFVKALFEIDDDRCHKRHQDPGCCGKHVERVPRDDVVTTAFEKRVDLLSVIKGKGYTYQEKIGANLYNIENLNLTIDRVQLMQQVVAYGLIRLFLSYLLYGKFDTKYLTGKYLCDFLKDLKESRYCRFVRVFENKMYRGFDKYYREQVGDGEKERNCDDWEGNGDRDEDRGVRDGNGNHKDRSEWTRERKHDHKHEDSGEPVRECGCNKR